jgi:hypothetical protein
MEASRDREDSNEDMDDLPNPVSSAVCGDLGVVPVGGGNSPRGASY